MGQAVRSIIGVAAAPFTAGTSLALAGNNKNTEPRIIGPRQGGAKPEQVLQPAKSRTARLAASRGRRSFRISLGTDGAGADGAPRQTRAGIAIG
jgi:hypothetical protein